MADPGPCVTAWAVKVGRSTVLAVARKPGFTTLSSSDQELVAVSSCVAAVVAMRGMAAEFGMPQEEPSIVGCDNNSVTLISRAAASFKSALYLARRAVFLQESTQEGHTSVVDVPTDSNYVDILTKSFYKKPRVFFQHVVKLLNLDSLLG